MHWLKGMVSRYADSGVSESKIERNGRAATRGQASRFTFLPDDPLFSRSAKRRKPRGKRQKRKDRLWRRMAEPSRRTGTLKTAICLLGAILLAGCTMTKAPDVPTFQSYFGQVCGGVCNREHDLCTSECTQMLKSGCKSECNQEQMECYDYCLEEESRRSP